MEYEEMTPKQLRDEATRRELIQRHLEICVKETARESVAKAIVDIPSHIVNASKTKYVLKNVLEELVKMNDAEIRVTNGDISLVSHGMPSNWWLEAIFDHPKEDSDSVLTRYKYKRLRLWE